ncbi:MAG: OmpA family protein [Paracoccaceae bacterium]
MRGFLGSAVLALGVGVLGFYAHGKTAVEIENGIAARSIEAVANSIHAVLPEVSGRDIRLTGIADSPAERDALMAAVDAVDGRRVVTDELIILQVAAPFVAQLTKAAPPAALGVAGVVPSVRVQRELAEAGWGEAAGKLALAAGAPDGWVALAKAGAAALGPLDTGEVTIADLGLTVTGVAKGPAEYAAMEAALAGLPEGAVTLDVTLLDDGTPNAFTVDYDVTSGATVTGKFPPGMTIADLTEALGLSEMAGASAMKQGLFGEPANVGLFASLSRFLPMVERLRVVSSPEKLEVSAEVGLAVDPADMSAAMQADIGSGVAISVTRAVDTAVNGATRTNAATGLQQRYAGGYWIAIPDFVQDRSTCQAETEAVLNGATINFESGSDVLTADSVQVLNRLAEVVIHCASETGLRAEIGGHTDSSGDALSNLGLSQKRATAVRLALVNRGVPGAALKAIGFGAERPIADNATEEGKARNRRTTIEWAE